MHLSRKTYIIALYTEKYFNYSEILIGIANFLNIVPEYSKIL